MNSLPVPTQRVLSTLQEMVQRLSATSHPSGVRRVLVEIWHRERLERGGLAKVGAEHSGARCTPCKRAA
jgi:hypothetical protein